MSLLVKAIAVFVVLWMAFRMANRWMAARIDPNRAVERVRQSPGFSEVQTPQKVQEARPAPRGESKPEPSTASFTFNLPAPTPASSPAPLQAPDPAPEPAPAASQSAAPAIDSGASTDAAATFAPANPPPTGKVPSLDSMELIPSRQPIGPFARKKPEPVDPVLSQLRSTDPAVRRQGLDALHEQRGSMSREEAHRLLWAAGGELPEVDEDETPVGEAILPAAEPWVGEGEVDLLRSVYPRLPTGARSQALALLASIGSREAAVAWVDCLERHGGGSQFSTRQSRAWSDALEHGDVFFPTLLDAGLPAGALEEVLLLALHFLDGGVFPGPAEESLEHAVVELWEETGDELHDGVGGPAWGWTERSRSLRRRAGILLDLMGFQEDDESGAALAGALTSSDARVRLYAVRATLRRGGELTAEHVAPVAASPETRRALYDFLKPAKKLSLMPRNDRSQKAMAEADLTRWLAFPTGLGHPPDEIEAMHVVSIDDEAAGSIDWHLVRFRSAAPAWDDKGWMLGVSGPWVRKEGPAGRARGDTFSDFAEWQELSKEQRISALRDLTEAWSGAD